MCIVYNYNYNSEYMTCGLYINKWFIMTGVTCFYGSRQFSVPPPGPSFSTFFNNRSQDEVTSVIWFQDLIH